MECLAVIDFVANCHSAVARDDIETLETLQWRRGCPELTVAPPAVGNYSSGRFGFDPYGLRMRSLGKINRKHAIFQVRSGFGSIDIRWQIDGAQDLIGAQLGADHLAFLLFFLGFALPCNLQRARLQTDFEILVCETWHFGADCKIAVRLLQFQGKGMQYFRFGAEPIVQITAEPAAILLK